MTIKRYAGCDLESPSGEYVKYEDIKYLIQGELTMECSICGSKCYEVKAWQCPDCGRLEVESATTPSPTDHEADKKLKKYVYVLKEYQYNTYSYDGISESEIYIHSTKEGAVTRAKELGLIVAGYCKDPRKECTITEELLFD